jgi:hypothetical protein
VGVVLIKARTAAGVGIVIVLELVCWTSGGPSEGPSHKIPGPLDRSELTRLETPPVASQSTNSLNAVQQQLTMTYEVSENKKRKVSPEPDAESSKSAPVSNLLIKRLSDKAKLPTRGSAFAAGYDLYR